MPRWSRARKSSPAPVVGNHEGEHAAKALDACFSPLLPGMDNHLGIGGGAELVTGCLQLAAQLAEVIKLAVVGDPDAAVFVAHGLGAGLQVDDRQAPMTEGDGMLAMQAFPVRPAMAKPRHHRLDRARRRRRRKLENAANPAHGCNSASADCDRCRRAHEITPRRRRRAAARLLLSPAGTASPPGRTGASSSRSDRPAGSRPAAWRSDCRRRAPAHRH